MGLGLPGTVAAAGYTTSSQASWTVLAGTDGASTDRVATPEWSLSSRSVSWARLDLFFGMSNKGCRFN